MPLDGQGSKLSQNESRERGMKAPNKKDQNLEKLVSLAKPLVSQEGWEKGPKNKHPEPTPNATFPILIDVLCIRIFRGNHEFSLTRYP